MKILRAATRIVGALFLLFSAFIMIYGLISIISGSKEISSVLIESGWDKFFFCLMFGGAGLGYLLLAVSMMFNVKLNDTTDRRRKPIITLGVFIAIAFAAGTYYCMMLGSPW